MNQYQSEIKMLKRLFTVALLLILTGCQNTLHKGPAFTESALPPGKDQALVYLFRIGSTPLWLNAPIYIGGNKVVDMPNRAYMPLYLKPGTHTVSIKWDLLAGQRNVEKTFTFEAGKTHYVALTKSDVTNIKVLLDAKSHYLGEFSRENAIGGLSQCMLVKPEKELN